VHRRLLIVLALSACGGGDGIDTSGMPGTPVMASFNGVVATIGVQTDGADKTFLVDTGAPMTIFDTDSFPSIPAGAHKETFTAFGVTFHDYPIGAWNLFADQPPTAADGIIGGDLLRHFAFTLDYQGGRAWIDDPFDPADIPADVMTTGEDDVPILVTGGGASQVPGTNDVLAVPATRVIVKVQLEGQTTPIWALVDSGASFVTIEESTLTALGDTPPRPRLDGIVVATANGDVVAYASRIWRATLVGVKTGDAQHAVDDLPVLVLPSSDLFTALSLEVHVPIQAFIGGTFLRRHLSTFDYQSRLLRLAPYTDNPQIDPREFVSPGRLELQTDSSGAWKFIHIYPSSNVAAAGILAGDALTQINGVTVTNMSPSAVFAILDAIPIGQQVTLGIDRGGTTQSFMIAVQDLLPSYPPP
jgi:predicted aspartyl protease